MDIESLLRQVKDAVYDDKDTPYQRGDSHGLIEKIEQLFGRGGAGQGTAENPAPASQDPLGDPADQEVASYPTGVRPASEDPLGDPSDQRNA